MGKQKEKN